jgi:hypothetical protein
VGRNTPPETDLASGLLLLSTKQEGTREYLSYVCRDCRNRWTVVRSTDVRAPANFLFMGEDEA